MPTATASNWYTPLAKHKLTLQEIVLFGVLGALTFGAKFVMAGLPNIEPVSLMVMVFAVTFGLRCLYPIYVYVAMELLYYGLGTWNIMYLYIWAVLALAAWLMRKAEHPLAWALLSAVFGMLFGLLCAPVDVCIGGCGYAMAKWVSGIPFDIAHCAGNFCMALILFKPLRKLAGKLYAQMKK